MKVNEYINMALKTSGISKRWLASHLGIVEGTLYSKFSKNNFNATELVKIAKLLDLDLNKLKEE